LVGQKQTEIEFKNKMIDIAEEMYDIDIKKKLSYKSLISSESTGSSTEGK